MSKSRMISCLRIFELERILFTEASLSGISEGFAGTTGTAEVSGAAGGNQSPEGESCGIGLAISRIPIPQMVSSTFSLT